MIRGSTNIEFLASGHLLSDTDNSVVRVAAGDAFQFFGDVVCIAKIQFARRIPSTVVLRNRGKYDVASPELQVCSWQTFDVD
jgi:hypothetical protein